MSHQKNDGDRTPIRYISMFSGIEAATVAWEPLGWEAVAFAEIEPFPSAVLAERFPDVPNLGDITKVDWSKYHGAANLVVGGFPCQSYSLAGLRKGLDDPRGNLMLEFLKACREIDPEWIVGENVSGLLSSNGGRDFQTLLEAVAILWPRGGISWRILDAQFVRVADRASDGTITGWVGPVAQRRRRVFIVINTRDWRRAAAVLIESEGVPGHPASSREKREELTRTTERSANSSGAGGAYTIKVRCGSDTYIKADGSIGTAGKGALVGKESAFTIAVTQDQTLITMSSGQANAEITQDGTCTTLTCLHEAPIICDQFTGKVNRGE